MEPTKDHFMPIFWLLAITLFLAMVYIFAITFLPIPEKNIRFADTAQGFLLGTVVGGIVAYFVGGSPPLSAKKLADALPGKTTATITADITTDTKPTEEGEVDTDNKT